MLDICQLILLDIVIYCWHFLTPLEVCSALTIHSCCKGPPVTCVPGLCRRCVMTHDSWRANLCGHSDGHGFYTGRLIQKRAEDGIQMECPCEEVILQHPDGTHSTYLYCSQYQAFLRICRSCCSFRFGEMKNGCKSTRCISSAILGLIICLGG